MFPKGDEEKRGEEIYCRSHLEESLTAAEFCGDMYLLYWMSRLPFLEQEFSVIEEFA
jgi:hypothetical protein